MAVMTSGLTAIVAVGRNGEIGRAGQLPWRRLAEDRHWFRVQTHGKALIMGRKTWDSLPARPLPGRPNIVLTTRWPGHDGPVQCLGCDLVASDREAIRAAEGHGCEPIVIGGASIFRLFWDRIDRVLMTIVDEIFEGADASFPDVPVEGWECEHIRSIPDAIPHPLAFYRFSRKHRGATS